MRLRINERNEKKPRQTTIRLSTGAILLVSGYFQNGNSHASFSELLPRDAVARRGDPPVEDGALFRVAVVYDVLDVQREMPLIVN